MTPHRIYTRKGDAGETGLFGGGRVSKADVRVDAYGEVDELNAVLGWALVHLRDATIAGRLHTVQGDLFAIGAHLATPARPGRTKQPRLPPLPAGRVDEMERWIDEAEDALPELRSFILPGGGAAGAALHLARTVCRRAERRVVALAQAEPVDPLIIVYLNRLSDLLFDLARRVNHDEGSPEERWEPSGK